MKRSLMLIVLSFTAFVMIRGIIAARSQMNNELLLKGHSLQADSQELADFNLSERINFYKQNRTPQVGQNALEALAMHVKTWNVKGFPGNECETAMMPVLELAMVCHEDDFSKVYAVLNSVEQFKEHWLNAARRIEKVVH